MNRGYPFRPGRKSPGTSGDAAREIQSYAATLRATVYSFLRERLPASFTADEIAQHLGADILSVRPRVTELGRLGLIEHTAERRKNKSGMTAQCWRARGVA